MSQENVEIVRGQWDAWNDGNLDKWAQAWDSEVVVTAPQGWPDGPVERGLDAWRRQAQGLRDTWGEARIEIDEIWDVDDRVLARFRYVTLGADTAIPFETLLRPRGSSRPIPGRRCRTGRASRRSKCRRIPTLR